MDTDEAGRVWGYCRLAPWCLHTFRCLPAGACVPAVRVNPCPSAVPIETTNLQDLVGARGFSSCGAMPAPRPHYLRERVRVREPRRRGWVRSPEPCGERVAEFRGGESGSLTPALSRSDAGEGVLPNTGVRCRRQLALGRRLLGRRIEGLPGAVSRGRCRPVSSRQRAPPALTEDSIAPSLQDR